MYSLRHYTVSFFALSALAAACSAGPGADSADSESSALAAQTQANWRRAMSTTPLPKDDGCFQATQPNTTWEEVPCIQPPNVPFVPSSAHGSLNVGNTTDWTAQTSGSLAWAEGSFPSVTGLTSEVDGTANSYSLQLNTNPFSGATKCSTSKSASTCQGWEQFVYSPGGAFIQYWLLGYGSTCPSGWNSWGGSDCWQNSSNSVGVPAEPASDLPNMTLTGSAGTTDKLTMSVNSTVYTMSQASVLGLNGHWTSAEFNIFGTNSGTEAVFNGGTSITVEVLTDSATSTTSAPTCANESFTGETTNLNLGSCSQVSGTYPGIKFTESLPAPVCVPLAQTTACSHHCSGDIVSNGCGRNYTCTGPAPGTAACCSAIGGHMVGKLCELI